MKICFVLLYHPDAIEADPQGALDRFPLLRHIPNELARLGHRVDVVRLWPRAAELQDGGVRHHFLPAGLIARAFSAAVARWLGRKAGFYRPAWRAARLVRRLRPDLVHFHGTVLHLNLGLLLMVLGRQAPPVVLQHHGGEPSSNRLVRRWQRRLLGRAARLLFTARSHAQPYIDAGVLPPGRGRIAEVTEASSVLRCIGRPAARQQTGMVGEPVFLSTARLHPIKDPLTVLRGFERIVAAWPRAQLYLHYLSEELLVPLGDFVAARPHLAGKVHFGGRAPAERMEAIYNSADFLIQASRREYSGYAVLEAMSCGVIPVVSDIPSFRAMIGNSGCGLLFPAGDDEALARGVLQIPNEEIPTRSRQVRAHFDSHLSFPSLAHRLEAVYKEVVGSASGPLSSR